MNNFPLQDLIIIGVIIYTFYQILTKGIKKATKPQQRPNPQINSQNPDLMDLFRSAVEEIKSEAAAGTGMSSQSIPPDADDNVTFERPASVYTEQLAEPAPLIRDPVKRSRRRKEEFRDESKIESSFEYLKPGELVITADDQTETQPIHQKLFDSLGDPHNLQHAVLLREVLDPPVSKRKRFSPKGSLRS